jgi:hypothetical protein
LGALKVQVIIDPEGDFARIPGVFGWSKAAEMTNPLFGDIRPPRRKDWGAFRVGEGAPVLPTVP